MHDQFSMLFIRVNQMPKSTCYNSGALSYLPTPLRGKLLLQVYELFLVMPLAANRQVNAYNRMMFERQDNKTRVTRCLTLLICVTEVKGGLIKTG